MLYGLNTGAVLVTLFSQYGMRPYGAATDREGWRAIAADRNAAGVLEDFFAAAHIGAIGVSRLAVDPDMLRAMTRQFVSVSNNAPHQCRMPIRNPSQRKKVACTADSARISSSRSVLRSTRRGRRSHSLLLMVDAKAST